MVPTFLKFDHWFGEGHFAQRIHFLRNYPLLHDFRVSRRGETRMRARVMPCTLPGRARAVPSTHFPTRPASVSPQSGSPQQQNPRRSQIVPSW